MKMAGENLAQRLERVLVIDEISGQEVICYKSPIGNLVHVRGIDAGEFRRNLAMLRKYQ